ncbi:MAG: hypothetical protein VKO64_00700 [Candidatus Sericytochromatia bacterium]|nr:hypothetical protein [Candidatus Sericytochromatia bacterium]
MTLSVALGSRPVVVEVGRHAVRAVWREGAMQHGTLPHGTASWQGAGDPARLLAAAVHTLVAPLSFPEILLVLACQDRFGGHRETLEGMGRLEGMLRWPLRLASVDGCGWPVRAACASGLPATRFAVPRAPGLRALAGAIPGAEDSAVVDLGASSAEWVSPGPATEASGAALERLRDGRLSWIGLLDTPVDAVLGRFRRWPVVPRHARIRAATRWLGLSPLPKPSLAERRDLAVELAAALALDPPAMLRAFPGLSDPFASLAHAIVRGAVRKLVRAWRPLGHSGDVVWVCGLGGMALARPALSVLNRRCGGDLERSLGLPPGHGVAAGWLMREEGRRRGAISALRV